MPPQQHYPTQPTSPAQGYPTGVTPGTSASGFQSTHAGSSQQGPPPPSQLSPAQAEHLQPAFSATAMQQGHPPPPQHPPAQAEQIHHPTFSATAPARASTPIPSTSSGSLQTPLPSGTTWSPALSPHAPASHMTGLSQYIGNQSFDSPRNISGIILSSPGSTEDQPEVQEELHIQTLP